MGQFAARDVKKRRNKFRWSSPRYKSKAMKLWKLDPLDGAPSGKAIVLKKKGVEQKQPHSGIIKCVRCQIVKNGIPVTAFVPGYNSIRFIDEHDEVMIEGVGGSQGSAIGSMHGIKYKVISVNGVPLSELLKGKKEKPKGA
jgi:small subunit ribosomal protein S12